MLRVLHDHTLLHSHPAGSKQSPQANGDLVVTEPGQVTGTTYVSGTWHGAGEGIACAYVVPNPACPNCYVPAPAVVAGPAPVTNPPPPQPRPAPA